MRRFKTLLLMLLVTTSLLAQENLEIVAKGKKQGVKNSTKDSWLIPMGKHKVMEPFQNLFLKIDMKNRTVQGFYQDQFLKRTTEIKSQQFFGDYNDYSRSLRFENITLNVEDHSITKPKFRSSLRGLSGPGAGFFGELLITASNMDSTDLSNIEVLDHKGNLVERFDKVLYSIEGNKLLIGRTTPKTDYDGSGAPYSVEKVEVFTIQRESLKLKDSYTTKDETMHQRVLYHIYGYSYEPIYDAERIDYENLLNTDYKADSSAKYQLILGTGAGILFANKDQQYHFSVNGEWEKVGESLFFKDNYEYGYNGYFSLENKEGVSIINSGVANQKVLAFDHNANQIYDENGYEVYYEEPDVQMGGVWSWEENTWIVPNEYADVILLNDKYVAQRFNFSTSEESQFELDKETQIDVFDLDGTKIASLKSPSEEEVLSKIYSGADIKEIPNSYNMYRVISKGNSALVDYSSDVRYAYEVASFKDGLIQGTYNTSMGSYYTFKDDKFFWNSYDVEMGVTTKELTTDFEVIVHIENDGYGFSTKTIKNKRELEVDRIITGIEVINNNQVIIYNNTYPSTFEKWNEFGEPGRFYDENGNEYYMFYYDSEGTSETGLWNLEMAQWDIKPAYFKIIPSSSGFVALKRSDVVNGEIIEEDDSKLIKSKEYFPVGDSISLDLYNKDLKLTANNLSPDEFLNSPKNFHYLVEGEHKLGKCIRKPTLVDEKNGVYDTYNDFWFKGENGISIVKKDPLQYSAELLVRDADWVYQSNYYLYAIRNDSLIIKDNSQLQLEGAVALPIGDEFEIYETANGVIISTDNGVFMVPATEVGSLTLEESDEVAPENFMIKIVGSATEIICQSFVKEDVFFFDEVYFDDNMATIKQRNDFVWTKQGSNWEIKMNANTITQTPFGFVLDYTFDVGFVKLSDEQNTPANELYTVDYQRIEGLEIDSYYSCKQVEGKEDLFVIYYGDKLRPELSGIISADGKVAIEACDYEINGNELKYSPCSWDGFGGIKFDPDGNPVVKTVELK